jgi:hypothetical protein
MWTVILHFSRGHVQITRSLTKEQAQELVRIAVFSNQDSVNCTVFRDDNDYKIGREQ